MCVLALLSDGRGRHGAGITEQCVRTVCSLYVSSEVHPFVCVCGLYVSGTLR